MKNGRLNLFVSMAVAVMTLFFIPIAAFADAVPWLSQTYTAYACAGDDGDLGGGLLCNGFNEITNSGSQPPISATIIYGPGTSVAKTAGSSSISTATMTAGAYTGHSGEMGIGRAEFSGVYNAITPEFFFTYSLALSGIINNPTVNAWFKATDQTSGVVLANNTLQLSSDPIILTVNTTPDHLISVDFGVEGSTDGYSSLSGGGTLNYATAVAPEPISSILFVTGGTLLAGRRFIRRKA